MINITIVIIMVVYSSYSNYSLIVVLSKCNNNRNKHDDCNTVDGSDN